MTRDWIAVASREHVLCGVAGGFAQVCHGKCGPLQRMKHGDWIMYYSPVELFGQKEPCQRFTAIGTVTADTPYQFAMSSDFIPWRRNITFTQANEVPIKPLIQQLSFIVNKKQWGFSFRRGCFTIPQEDFYLIAQQMGVTLP